MGIAAEKVALKKHTSKHWVFEKKQITTYNASKWHLGQVEHWNGQIIVLLVKTKQRKPDVGWTAVFKKHSLSYIVKPWKKPEASSLRHIIMNSQTPNGTPGTPGWSQGAPN